MQALENKMEAVSRLSVCDNSIILATPCSNSACASVFVHMETLQCVSENVGEFKLK